MNKVKVIFKTDKELSPTGLFVKRYKKGDTDVLGEDLVGELVKLKVVEIVNPPGRPKQEKAVESVQKNKAIEKVEKNKSK